MPEIGGGLVLNIYRKHSQQSQSTIPPPRRQTQDRRTEMTAGRGLELHKDLKNFPPNQGPPPPVPLCASHPRACVSTRMCTSLWEHINSALSILYQATICQKTTGHLRPIFDKHLVPSDIICQKIMSHLRPVSDGRLIIKVQFPSSSANIGTFSDWTKHPLVIKRLHCYGNRVPKMFQVFVHNGAYSNHWAAKIF